MTLRKKNILVVDDDLSFGRLMERMLLENGYDCVSVTSGQEALVKLSLGCFDLVMTDINMPKMDGLQLIEKLREQFIDTAILVTTGVSNREVANRALEMGAYGYLLKPCDDFEVVIHLTNALRRAELERINRVYQQELEVQVTKRTVALKLANQSLEEVNQMLRQQEKLASIGQLAAGIAHEIKTPTGFVASNLLSLKKYQQRMVDYIAALQRTVDTSAAPEEQAELKALARKLKIDMILDDVGELVDNCSDGTERIKLIIKGLKDFSRQDQVKEQNVDLNQAVRDSLILVNNELKYKAELQLELQELPPLCGYQQRLGQVFINLLINAAQAFSQRGIIKVSTQLEHGVVVARIADNGCGIAEENLAKIFEPFYTTKEIGVGTGLGLSIIKEIVAEHQGTIEVESTVGVGTVFTLRFQPQ